MSRRVFLFILASLIISTTSLVSRVSLPAETSSNERYEKSVVIDPTKIVWTETNGPEGGDFIKIEVNPSNPNELLTGNSRNLYRSVNKGEEWELVETLPENHIFEIIFNPINSSIAYVSTLPNGVYRSLDGGDTWTQINEGIDNLNVQKLVIDASNPEVLYAGTHGGGKIYKTMDGGNTWSDKTGNFTIDKVTAIGLISSEEVYVGGGGSLMGEHGRLYHTTDSGTSWKVVDVGQEEDAYVQSILVNPNDNEEILIGFADAYNRLIGERSFLFKTTDGGKNWHPIKIHPGLDTHIDLLTYSEKNDDTIFLASGNLHKSVDSGETWTMLLGGVFSPECMALSCMDFLDLGIDPLDENVLYLPLNGAGIAKSLDGGNTWKHINNGLRGMGAAIMAADPFDPKTVYVGVQPRGSGTFKTTNRGDTWTKLDAGGIYHPFADEIYVHPTNSNIIYHIADVAILFKSTDAGNTWESQFDPHHGQYHPYPAKTNFRFSPIYALEVAPSDSNVLYVAKNGFGIFKSEDGCTTPWTYQLFSPDYTYSIAVDPTDPDVVYSGYQRKVFENNSGVYKRNGVDANWEEIFTVPNSLGVKSVEVDPSNPNRVYAGVAGSEGGIFFSNDHGETWQKLNEDLTFTTIWGHSQLQIDPTDKNTVYAGTWGGGTYKTINGAQDWSLLDENHTFSPTFLAISKKDPNTIYACDRTEPKIHRSDDAGETWYTYYDFGEGHMLTSAVVIDPDDPDVIYAATFKPPMAHGGILMKIKDGQGIADLSSGLPRSVLDIEIDVNNPSVLYVTTHIHGVFKSTNGGDSWEQLDDRGTGLPRTGFYDIDVDPMNSSTLYATALCGELPDYMLPAGVENLEGRCGVYKSIDGGQHWAHILETISEAKGIDVDPNDSNNLYVADMMGGVWVSNNGGQNWRQENTGLGSISMTSVKIKDDYIYASTQGSGVYSGIVNSDRSITWDTFRSNKPKAEVLNIQIEVDLSNPNRVYASAYPGGLLRSDDGGLHWNDKNFLTPSIEVDDPNIQGYYSFAINPSYPDIVWLGVYGKGMFVSYDGMDYNMFASGRNNEMMGKKITKVVVNPANPNEVYVSSEDGIFMTNDNGETWNEMNEGLPTKDVFTLAIGSDGKLYAGTRGYGVFRFISGEWCQTPTLSNFGVFWSTWERPLYQYSDMLINPENPDIMYLSSFPTGIYKSVDGGETWKESNIGFIDDGTDGIFSLTFHPYNKDIIYAGTYNGISVTYDGGGHWKRLSNGIPPEQWVYSVAIDPTDPNIMYAASKNGQDKGFHERHPPGTFHGVVVKTIDGGKNWFRIMDGLDKENEFYCVVMHPCNNSVLFLSTSHSGVYFSGDAGNHWVPMNRGLENLEGASINNVADNLVIDCEGRYLYFGTMGSGVWRANLTSTVCAYDYCVHVLDGDGENVENANVTLFFANGTHFTSKPTNATGWIEFPNIPITTYDVRTFYSGVQVSSLIDTLLIDGQTKTVNAEIYDLVVHVISEEGNDLPHVEVTVFWFNGTEISCRSTNSTGHVVFENMPGIAYFTGVTLEGYKHTMVKTTLASEDQLTTVTPQSGIVQLFITLNGVEYIFSVESNSTISNMEFDTTTKELSFNVTGPLGTTGYSKVTIAKELVEDINELKVYIDRSRLNYTTISLDDSWVVHFTYQHSTHRVTIIPEFPTMLILPLIMIATLLTIIICKRKHHMR